MSAKVLVMLNVLGMGLDESQIEAVLNLEDETVDLERKWLSAFFKLHPSELTRNLLTRYAQADKRMARISAGTQQEDIYSRLIVTLVSAKKCFSYGEYIACIELCALHGEMLANYLCITSKEDLNNSLSKLSKKDQDVIKKDFHKVYFPNRVSQLLRLGWLYKANVIAREDKTSLEEVHKLRILYFHHWSKEGNTQEEDAINALSVISPVTAKYLEILGDKPGTFNTANLERVKKYMEIVSGTHGQKKSTSSNRMHYLTILGASMFFLFIIFSVVLIVRAYI